MFTLRRLAMTVAAAVALAALLVALTRARTGPETGPSLSGDPAVELVEPRPGSLVLRQSRIGVDLATGYTGTLRIGNVAVPDEQLQRNDPLNQVYFQPGPGQVIEELTPGRHCATAEFWPIAQGRASSRTTEWCFAVS